MTPDARGTPPLPPPLDAGQRTLHDPRAGRLACYEDARGGGVPLVLLHSVNAAASAYEVRPLFEWYRRTRHTVAMDLPGFGLSERGDRPYTPALYVAAIEGLLGAVVPDGGSCDVVALSLTGEFAAAAVAGGTSRVRSLALVSPTGLGDASPGRAGAGRGGVQRVLRQLLEQPFLGQPAFDLLVTRPSIRFFLAQSFGGRVDEGLVEYAWRAAHQPGARFAPLAFLGGGLFTPDARERFYVRTRVPGLVLHDDAPHVGFGALPGLVARNPRWRALRIDGTRGLPHYERPEVVTAALDAFWADVARPGDARPA